MLIRSLLAAYPGVHLSGWHGASLQGGMWFLVGQRCQAGLRAGAACSGPRELTLL